MHEVDAGKFMMQTNGILLDQLSSESLRNMDTILVSVDGTKELTDYYRGRGAYDRVVHNLKDIREKGFAGEAIARMTVGRETRIDREVSSLLFDENLFDSIHWQLDALFWHNDYDKESFSNWVEGEYSPGVRNLVNMWVDQMRKQGRVHRIYPLIGIMESLLLSEPTKLRCGAGWTMFNIQTDGNITPCPVMAGMRDYYLGNIKDTNPDDLSSKAVYVSKPCPNCSIYSVCGGRCLYANVTKLWGDEGFALVCGTVRELVEALRRVAPQVLSLISERRVSLKDFSYPKYNSCEIIP
jgi:putative peptide-modifying radical SAM enzyme